MIWNFATMIRERTNKTCIFAITADENSMSLKNAENLTNTGVKLDITIITAALIVNQTVTKNTKITTEKNQAVSNITAQY